MTVENVTYISDLEPANPKGGDSIAQGDNHIRNTKLALRNTFPNIDGEVKASDEELNYLQGLDRPISDIIQEGEDADSALEARVTKNEQDIALKADKSYVDAQDGALSSRIDALEAVDHSHTIDSHTDVDLTGITEGCALVWDGAKWIAKKVGGGMLTLVEQPATVGSFSIKQGSYSKPATDDIYYATPVSGNNTVTFTVPAGKVFVMDYFFCLGYVDIDLNSIKVDGVTMMPGVSGAMQFDSPFDEDFDFMRLGPHHLAAHQYVWSSLCSSHTATGSWLGTTQRPAYLACLSRRNRCRF